MANLLERLIEEGCILEVFLEESQGTQQQCITTHVDVIRVTLGY